MDKAFKFAIIVGVLLAGFGLFYHYVIYLPDVEQRRVERERAEKEAARRDEIEAAKRAAIERAEAALRAEAERVEAAKRAEIAKHEANLRNLQRKSAYYSCLDGAGKSYDANWANACKAQAKVRFANLEKCLNDPNIVGNQFMGVRYCHSTYGGADPSPTCSLPGNIADDINKLHDKAKQQCLAEAKLF